MKLIAGLGNPGVSYENTRHNIGFRIIDLFAMNSGFEWKKSRYESMTASGNLENGKIMLVKPITYMNRSGEAIQSMFSALRIKPEELVVICDDMDLPLGKIRIRLKGGSGGHHGLESIISAVGGNFTRLRAGIGRPREKENTEKFVLEPFANDEKPVVEEMVKKAAEAIECAARYGLEKAMNTYNV